MELRHLRYLVVIADTGAFVRAAEKLHVAQPALTRQMHDLEKELGATLFDPSARRATLTPAGEACARIARHVIQDTEKAVARARLSNSGVIGRCVVTAGPVQLASGVVSGFITRMRSRFPGITVVVRESWGKPQWTALERAEADVGLGYEPTESIPALSMAMQYVDTIDRAAVAPDHDLARRETVSIDDLFKVPLLAVEPGLTSAFDRITAGLKSAWRERGLPADGQDRREFPSVDSLFAHVRAGQGWTLVPSSMSPMLPGVVMVKVTGLQIVVPTMRIWRRAESQPVVLTVLDQLRRFQQRRGTETPAPTAPPDGEADVVPPRLELRHLRSFLAVVQYGSLGRAAEIVGVTQPALSRQMRELEYDVGVALFSRESRGMEITPAGETFRDDVGDVLSMVDKIPHEIRRSERAQAQRCVIAVVPHPAIDAIVARVVADLESRGERIRVGTRSVMSVDQAAALHAGDIDVALGHAFPVATGGSRAEHLASVPLIHDRISVALLPHGHVLATRSTLHVRELADMPFVWTDRDFHPAFYDMVFARLGAAGLRPRVEGEFEGLATIWSLVREGAGWTLGWQSHLREPPSGLTAVPLADFNLPWGVVMTYRQDEARVPVLATIDALVEHARQLSPAKAPDVALPASHIPEVRIS